MSERTASSSAASVPDQRGALRVPDNVALASSVPRTRQPGGARADHTPTSGRRARTLPASGASAGHGAASAPHCRRVLAVASISPARALAHCRRAFRLSASSCTLSSACRTPAGVPRLVAAVDAGVMVVTLPGPSPWPVLTLAVSAGGSALKMRKSPWVRRRLAVARRDSVVSTFHWPSSSRSVASPRRASRGCGASVGAVGDVEAAPGTAVLGAAVGAASMPNASTQARGRPCSVPCVCRRGRPPATVVSRTGCQRSATVPGTGPVICACPALACRVSPWGLLVGEALAVDEARADGATAVAGLAPVRSDMAQGCVS